MRTLAALFLSVIVVAVCLAWFVPCMAAPPRSLDDRLVIELFAAEPDIVTPTGIAWDTVSNDCVYCIESHTHFRPEGYSGPPTDRIRKFQDTDGDGRADKITTYFEGTKATMGIAHELSGGGLYVASRSELFKMAPSIGKIPAEKERLVWLDTTGDYPHNGLNGMAFDALGRIYFGQGENLGAEWTLRGSDGKSIHGGDGGRLYRCDRDGRNLEQIAEGCWNPFGQCFDAFGQLFVVDNDPDSRPPCRLLHVVPGADFGYRFSNGRKGLHPFSCWNGELPGTLPMVAGTGEAPSAVLVYEALGFPEDYYGKLFVTSWGDHRVDCYELEQVGATWRSTFKPVIVGDEDFRPVGITLAADGSLYVSDWVDKSYELHGKGRIWHIKAKADARSSDAESEKTDAEILQISEKAPWKFLEHPSPQIRAKVLTFVLPLVGEEGEEGFPFRINDLAGKLNDEPDARVRALIVREARFNQAKLRSLAGPDIDPLVRAEALRRLELSDENRAAILLACASTDPFLSQAARRPLVAAMRKGWKPEAWLPDDPSLLLTYQLAAKEANCPPADETIRAWLTDREEPIRLTAIRWVGEQRWQQFRPELEAGLSKPDQSPLAFASVLAALERLDGVKREVSDEDAGETYVAKLIGDAGLDLGVLTRAVHMLRPDHTALNADVLGRLFESGQLDAQLTAVHVWADRAREDDQERLLKIAVDTSLPRAVRLAAMAGVRPQGSDARTNLLALACDADDALAPEALRSLRGAELSADDKSRIKNAASRSTQLTELAQLLCEPTSPTPTLPPTDIDAWLAALDGDADADVGERVFFHPQGPGCAKCHQVAGRGARVGPDLTVTTRQLDRRRLVASILAPSAEVAPQFVTWNIATQDGLVRQGMLVAEAVDGTQSYVQQDGARFDVRPADIAERRAVQVSIMPDHLELRMTAQEFRDLVAFLTRGIAVGE